MRVGNLDGRAVIITDDGAIDIHTASDGKFGPTPRDIYDDWPAFREWANSAALGGATAFNETDLDSPCPEPRQVFGIGLNYRKHAIESGMDIPTTPMTFTKFPSCITGPHASVRLPSESVDWEAEMVVVIGARAENVSASNAWNHVAGVTVGQDFSERVVQMRPPAPQFSLGKSYPGFGATGPWVTTVDALDDRDSLPISCTINGETMQDANTDDLIFSVGEIIEGLSSIVPMLAGDIIFTGTPSGVGMALNPRRFLTPGDVVVTTLGCVGSITTTCTD